MVKAVARSQAHEVSAEESVLGGILFRGPALVDVADVLAPADFFDIRHEAIYSAMLDLEGRGEPIDLLTVAARMQHLGTLAKLAAVGHEAYLADLANRVATTENIRHHARLVRAAALKRRLVVAARRITELGADPEVEAEQLLDHAQRAIFDVAGHSTKTSYKPLREVLARSVAALEHRYTHKQAVTGVPTGFHELDEKTAGLQPGHLTVLAARPSMGKTALALGIAQHAAIERRIPVLFFSLEMADQELVERALASEGRVDSHRVRTGYLEARDWISLGKGAPRLGEAPIWLDDSGEPTLMEIRTKVRRWRADPAVFPPGSSPLGLVVIDYLQMVAPGESRSRSSNREQEISEISRGLKALAKETRLPVVALSQLNRSVESRADKRPMPSDLRESGAIEQDADLICFIYRDEVYNPDTDDKGVAEIIVAKQRNGPTGTVKLTFLKAYTRFENLSQRDDGGDRPRSHLRAVP